MSKKFSLSILVSLMLCFGAAAVEYVYPVTPFDPTQAQVLLERGSLPVSGRLKSSVHANVSVGLYPLTEHFEQYLQLQDQLADQPGQSPAIDLRARGCRRLVNAKDGAFAFDDVKPGRYYLEWPAMYNRGDSPEIDAIFDGGGCVRFLASHGRIIEVKEGGLVLEL